METWSWDSELEKKVHLIMVELFSKRKIWLVDKIKENFTEKISQSDSGPAKMSKLVKPWLREFCFYWSDGSWRNCWCLRGYDPRLKENALDSKCLFQKKYLFWLR